MAYVYKHIRKDTNEVFYIGIGKHKKRAYTKSGRNNHWNNITNKTDFIVEIIEGGLSWETVCEREKYWISYYGRRDLNEGTLVNMTDGGDGTPNITPDVRVKTSIRQKKLLSDKTYNPMYGKTHTLETKLKISKANVGKTKGIKRSKEFSENLSKKLKGRVFTQTHIDNLSKANHNRNVLACPHCGKSSTHNMERYHYDNCKTIKNNIMHRSKTRLGSISVTDTDGVETIYESCSEAARALKADLHSIILHAKNITEYKYGRYKGYKFKLIEL